MSLSRVFTGTTTAKLSFFTMLACSWALSILFFTLAVICLFLGNHTSTSLYYAYACFGTSVALCPGIRTPLWARLLVGLFCLVLLSVQ